MTLKETLRLYYEGEVPSLYEAPTPYEGLPDADTFFATCKELQDDWRGLITDGGYYATESGLEVWWMLAFGCVYAALPELDAYYRWAGNDEQKPVDKAHQIEHHFWEREEERHRLNDKYGEE